MSIYIHGNLLFGDFVVRTGVVIERRLVDDYLAHFINKNSLILTKEAKRCQSLNSYTGYKLFQIKFLF